MAVLHTETTTDPHPCEPGMTTVGDSRPAISLFFPAYNDGEACRILAHKAIGILGDVASRFEIVIVNDGSADNTGRIADELAESNASIRVVHHPRNMGYGKAVQTGFANVHGHEWICFTDGDNQYDIGELRHIVQLLPRYDVILGFRLRKTYGRIRQFLSATLNLLVRLAFGTRFRDVTCGFKLVRRSVIEQLTLTSGSAFVGAEIAVRSSMKGFVVGEVGINSYPREYGRSNIISFRSLWRTWSDLVRLRRELFRNGPRPV